MQITLLVAQVLHVLSGVFWAGSTFAVARSQAAFAGGLFRPQMGAAALAVVTGGVLWYLQHFPHFGVQEQVLALGALAAAIAAGVQGAVCGSALRQLATAVGTDRSLLQVTLGHRVAAGLLAVTVICMAAARYA